MTKAEEVHSKVEALVAAGSTKAGAFKKLAADYGQPVDSIRGSFYTHTPALDAPARQAGAGDGRPRWRRQSLTQEPHWSGQSRRSTARSRKPTTEPRKPRPKPTR